MFACLPRKMCAGNRRYAKVKWGALSSSLSHTLGIQQYVLAQGSLICCFQITDLWLCWFKPAGNDRKACLSIAFGWNVSMFLHEVYVSYVSLSLAQQMALDKSANFCGPVLCSSYLMPAFVPGKWAELSVCFCTSSPTPKKFITTESVVKDCAV